jgi:hypothetical protein
MDDDFFSLVGSEMPVWVYHRETDSDYSSIECRIRPCQMDPMAMQGCFHKISGMIWLEDPTLCLHISKGDSYYLDGRFMNWEDLHDRILRNCQNPDCGLLVWYNGESQSG